MTGGRAILMAAVALAVIAALLAYLGWRLVGPSRLRGRARTAAWAALVLVVVLNVASRALVRALGGVAGFVLGQLTGFATGLIVFVLLLLLARDLGWLLARGADALVRRFAGRGFLPADPARRLAWLRRSGQAVLAGSVVLVALGYVGARQEPELVRVPVEVAGLPKELDGYRIALVSDVHLGGSTSAARFGRIVSRVNDLHADLVAITGDLAETPVADSGADAEAIATLEARDGVYYVPGNHEVYAGVDDWVALVRSLGATVLLNEHRVIRHGEARLIVAGVPNVNSGVHGTPPGATGIAALESSPEQALRGAPPADYRVLLAHQPSSATSAERAGFDLMLAGHTHGGQYFPMSALQRAFLPLVAGMGRRGRLQIYVSRGIGVYVFPMRLGVPPEITLLELRRK